MGYVFCYLKNKDTNIHIYNADIDKKEGRIYLKYKYALCNTKETEIDNIHSAKKYCNTLNEAKQYASTLGRELCGKCISNFYSDK